MHNRECTILARRAEQEALSKARMSYQANLNSTPESGKNLDSIANRPVFINWLFRIFGKPDQVVLASQIARLEEKISLRTEHLSQVEMSLVSKLIEKRTHDNCLRTVEIAYDSELEFRQNLQALFGNFSAQLNSFKIRENRIALLENYKKSQKLIEDQSVKRTNFGKDLTNYESKAKELSSQINANNRLTESSSQDIQKLINQLDTDNKQILDDFNEET